MVVKFDCVVVAVAIGSDARDIEADLGIAATGVSLARPPVALHGKGMATEYVSR